MYHSNALNFDRTTGTSMDCSCFILDVNTINSIIEHSREHNISCLELNLFGITNKASDFLFKLLNEDCTISKLTLVLGSESKNYKIDQLLNFIEQNTNITELSLSNINRSDKYCNLLLAKSIGMNTTLQKVEISSVAIKEGFNQLANSIISHKSIIDVSFNNIVNLSSIEFDQMSVDNFTCKSLSFINCNINGVLKYFLPDNNNKKNVLESINIGLSKLSKDDYDYLLMYIDNNRIKNFELAGIRISSDKLIFEKICKCLCKNRTIKKIDLHYCSLSDDDLCKMIDSFVRYKVINISMNNLTSFGITLLIDTLKNNNNLSILKIGDNPMTNECISLVFQWLESNNCVTHFDISNVNCSDHYSHIGSMIQSNTNLKYLNLSNCGITGIGMRSIAESLEENKTLEYIDLERNDITDMSDITYEHIGQYFKNSLEFNTVIKKIKGINIDDYLLSDEYREIKFRRNSKKSAIK